IIVANNPDIPRRLSPRRPGIALRWAWLLEGAARWFGGPGAHARPAIARRLREGRRPSFPPGVRDAPLLGGTVIDLLVRERGEPAAAQLACRLHPHGPRGALRDAFGGRSPARTEEAWHAHLTRMTSAACTSEPAEQPDDQCTQQQGDQQPRQQPAGGDHSGERLVGDQLALQENLAGGR